MAFLILHSPNLSQLCTSPLVMEFPELDQRDRREYYCCEDGDGLWIPSYISFLERIVRTRCHLPDFVFSDDQDLCASLFEEIPCGHVRTLLVEFTNVHFAGWRDDDIDVPDFDVVRSDCRSYCDNCDSAYEHTYGKYDGPLAEDVEENEDDQESDIDKKERQARIARNRVRQREREHLETAQEDSEAEIVDSEWICDHDCDAFIDYAEERYRERFESNTDALEQRFEQFLTARGEKDFPPLIVTLASAS